MSICILNLSSKNITDDILNALLINAPQRSIILLEDIDAAVDRKPENVSGTCAYVRSRARGAQLTECG